MKVRGTGRRVGLEVGETGTGLGTSVEVAVKVGVAGGVAEAWEARGPQAAQARARNKSAGRMDFNVMS